jgi:hypothetical protein
MRTRSSHLTGGSCICSTYANERFVRWFATVPEAYDAFIYAGRPFWYMLASLVVEEHRQDVVDYFAHALLNGPDRVNHQELVVKVRSGRKG